MHFVRKYLFRLLLLLLLVLLLLLLLFSLLIIIIIIIISQYATRVVYRQDVVIHKFVRIIMTLPFLPAQHIQSMFVRIEFLVPPNYPMGKCAVLLTTSANRGSNIHYFVPIFGQCTTSVRFSHNRSGQFWYGLVFTITRS